MLPISGIKLKILTAFICSAAVFALAGEARADIFVDNAATGCANGSQTYNPSTRACSGGTHTVYTSFRNMDSGISDGTESNPTIVNVRSGTYYQEAVLHHNWITVRKYPEDASKPLLDGQWTRPSFKYRGLLMAVERKGIVIDGLAFTRAAWDNPETAEADGYTAEGLQEGHAINFYSVDNCVIKNCDFTEIGDIAIGLLYSSGASAHIGNNNLIENNNIDRAGLAIMSGGYWAGAITTQHHLNTHIKGNVVARSFGEGIHPVNGEDGDIIEYNTVIDNKRIAIYMGGVRNITVRHNLVYHTMSDSVYVGGGWSNQGIVMCGENPDYPSPAYNKGYQIYGNIVTGCRPGIGFIYHPTCDICNVSDTKIQNNTLIESNLSNSDTALLYFNPGYERFIVGSGIEIKNNIFFQTAGTIANVPAGITWSNNLWSKAPDADARSSTDPTYAAGYPTLNIADYFQKQSGWITLTVNSLTGQEFALRSTAVHAINKGTNLGAPYNQLLNLSTSNFKTNTFNLIDQNANGAWDIGAGVYAAGGGGDTQAPAVPSGLAVR